MALTNLGGKRKLFFTQSGYAIYFKIVLFRINDIYSKKVIPLINIIKFCELGEYVFI